MNNDDNKAITDFVSNSHEQLRGIRVVLLHLQRSPADAAVTNAIPCAILDNKKLSDFHGWNHIVSFSWAFEAALSRVRDAKIHAEVDLIVLLLACCDHICEMLNQLALSNSKPLPEIPVEKLVKSIDLIRQLRARHAYLGNGKSRVAANAMQVPAANPSTQSR